LSAAEVALQQIEEKKGLLHLNSQVGAIVSNVAMARAEIAAKRVELQALKSFSTEHNPDVKLAE
jgi:capsule polysaccharide export protein KpsE/RkpR